MSQEFTMQQRPKATPVPSGPSPKAKAQSVPTKPIALDEKTLRQIAGGVSPSGPNGTW